MEYLGTVTLEAPRRVFGRRALCIAAMSMVMLITARPAGAAPPVELSTLLERFAEMPGLSAHFREEKRLAMLEMPLVNEGSLHYARGAFARHVTSPKPSSLVVRDGKLSFVDTTGREDLDLTSNPVAALFVESFTKILAGDGVALESMYRLELHETGMDERGRPGWKLALHPKVAPLDQVIAVVEVFGHDVELDTMRIVEVGGDETITTFDHVDADHQYSNREFRRLFTAKRRPTEP